VRLTAKILAFFLLATILLVAVDAYLTVRREVELFEKDTELDAVLLGHSLRDLVADVWQSSGQSRALELIEAANEDDRAVGLRWVWLDESAGDPYRPRAALEELAGAVGGRDVFLRVGDTSAGRFYAYIPVTTPGGRPGGLEISKRFADLRAYTRTTIIRVVLLAIAMVVASTAMASFLGVWLVGRPLRRLINRTRSMGEGDLSSRLELSQSDELGELASRMNWMCDQLTKAQERIRSEAGARIAAVEALRHEDRLRTVGRLASGVAHELGTPLNVISGRAGLIVKESTSPRAVVEHARIITAQTDRAAQIIRQLLDFGRRPQPKRTMVDLRQVAHQTLELVGPLARDRGVHVSVVGDDRAVEVKADAAQIQQVLANLVINATQATSDGDTVEVGIHDGSAVPEHGRVPGGRFACLTVSDRGVGMTREVMEQILEPFFTTKEVGAGTGLGLSIADSIVRDHGGWLDVESRPGEGSRFAVFLPRE
jgi:signal transduction histidine kinase